MNEKISKENVGDLLMSSKKNFQIITNMFKEIMRTKKKDEAQNKEHGGNYNLIAWQL